MTNSAAILPQSKAPAAPTGAPEARPHLTISVPGIDETSPKVTLKAPAKFTAKPSASLEEKRPALARALVASIDFDNCIAFNLEKIRKLKTDEEKIAQILIDILPLLESIAKRAVDEGFEDLVIFIGTARQSWQLDYLGSFLYALTQGTGPSYPIYKAIENKLKTLVAEQYKKNQSKLPMPTVTLNTTTTADIYSLGAHGSNFFDANYLNSHPKSAADLYKKYLQTLSIESNQKLLFQRRLGFLPMKVEEEKANAPQNQYIPSPTLADSTKISTIYSQIHNITNLLGKEILFMFFDDNKQVVLDSLDHFYKEHKTLIPKQTVLQLYRVTGNQCQLLSTIPGTGITDEFFEENLIIWGAIVLNIIKIKDEKIIIDNAPLTNIDDLDIANIKLKLFNKLLIQHIGTWENSAYPNERNLLSKLLTHLQGKKDNDNIHTAKKAALFERIRAQSTGAILKYRATLLSKRNKDLVAITTNTPAIPTTTAPKASPTPPSAGANNSNMLFAATSPAKPLELAVSETQLPNSITKKT